MAAKKKSTGSAAKLSRAELREMIDEATVDAHDDGEQLMGFSAMLDQELALPFETEVLGVVVQVVSVMQRGASLCAICQRGRIKQAIELSELPLPSPLPKGAEWIGAYAHWSSSRW